MTNTEKFRIPALRQATYRLNVASPSQLPPDEGYEVAFAGRSNVGKSSTLNAIVDQKGLARTSSQPGRTQQLVYFDIDPERRLVDLPGYGYARAPAEIRRQWSGLIERYLEKRESLRGIMLIMDIRHPFTDFDQMMIDWAHELGKPVHVLLNKADKLSRSAALQVLARLRREHQTDTLSMQLFSAAEKSGIGEAHQKLGEWLAIEMEVKPE
ncbi:ribosome biogenesis GTP-binding protein YihA/YsxC [Thermithiobacillus plumbiphilus]|uniref:Probable GTP-binding protein EngB n=1 Tax=Thermithiobacillus plumbiphilus TaxID=1729899 RepID=A0ABU9D976_9PROT